MAGSLGSLSALSSLDLGGNLLGDAGAAALAPALPLLARSLKRLCLSDCGFGDEGVAELETALPALTALQALDLDGCLECSASKLLPCLGQLTTLTLLSLSRNRVGKEELAALVPCLARLTALQHLGLEACQLRAMGASPLLHSLGAALGKLVSLTHLEMSRNAPFNAVAVALANDLVHLTALRHLGMSCNGIEETGLDSLAPALMRMPALRLLDLSRNSVNDVGAIALAMHLRGCSGLEQLKLEQLNLLCVGVGTEGATALSGLLREHLRSLQLLSLSGCPEIGSAGVFSLAGALCGLVSLRHLNLSRVCKDTHSDGPDAACALAAALAGLTGLTYLDLRNHAGFGEAGAIALADSFCGLSRLRHMEYSSCCAKAGGLAALCGSLRGLSRLQHLNLSDNQRGHCSGVAAALGQALPSLAALTMLKLSHNDLDEGGAAALASGISGLSRLRQLELHGNCFGDGGVASLGNSIKVGWCNPAVCASAHRDKCEVCQRVVFRCK